MPPLAALHRVPVLGPWLTDREAGHIAGHFTRVFEPRLAREPAERDAVHALRHEVYCEEWGFEPRQHDQRERDGFDGRALHAFLRHRDSGVLAGTVRVVICAEPGDRLPMEVHAADALAGARLAPSTFPRESVCEISRLAVSPHFRRKAHAVDALAHRSMRMERQCRPWVTVALYFCAAALVRQAGRHHAFVMVEPRLARAMATAGIRFRQVGPCVAFRGERAVHYLNRTQWLESLPRGFRRLLDTLDGSLDRSGTIA